MHIFFKIVILIIWVVIGCAVSSDEPKYVALEDFLLSWGVSLILMTILMFGRGCLA